MSSLSIFGTLSCLCLAHSRPTKHLWLAHLRGFWLLAQTCSPLNTCFFKASHLWVSHISFQPWEWRQNDAGEEILGPTTWSSRTGSLLLLLFNFLFYFTTQYWFCHTLTWIHHGCTWVPNPESPTSPPLSPYHLWVIPVHQPQASCIVSNVDWWYVSYMIVYIFQCCSPKSSHPLPFHRVQNSVLYICVSFAVSYTGLSLHLSKFHIYVLVYCINVFLSGLLHSV